MCLGIPGCVVAIEPNPFGMTMGKVSFAGVIKEVCLAYVPEVRPGDYVIVHVGFAISTIDPDEAARVFTYLEQLDGLSELDVPESQIATE